MSILSTSVDSAAHCEFCQLPVPAAVDSLEPQYCCYGCRFAASLAAAEGDEGQARWTMIKLGLAVFFAMNVMVCTLLLWSEQDGTTEPFAAAWYGLFRYAALLFTLPVVLLLGQPLFVDAGREVRRGRPAMSLLLSLGVGAALAYSIYSLFTGGHVYFEVSCAILVAVTLGKWMEAQGKLQSSQALRALGRLLPDQVRVVRDGVEAFLDLPELKTGDRFRVLPGERIVADGLVIAGEALVDQQVVTGESLPISKTQQDQVLSGTLVLDGPLVVEASSPADQGTIARMIAAVQQATQSRTRYERLAERISRWFVQAVMVIASLTLLAHMARGNVEEGLLAAVAVLVIACPCSLGLATPLAYWAAIGRAAERGILIRDGDAFIQFAETRTICFDKTGTLTTGEAGVSQVRLAANEQFAQVAAVAMTLVRDSSHPLSAAIRQYLPVQPASDNDRAEERTRYLPGRGMVGHFPNLHADVYLGARRWLTESGQDCSGLPATDFESSAEVLVAWGGQVRAQFLCADPLRADARETIVQLQRQGLRPLILTGDRAGRTAALAQELQVDFAADLYPEEKLNKLRQLPPAERPVAMVGDGINDAPALAAADVSVAMGSGSDISRHSAAICLLGSDLQALLFLRRLSRQTTTTIKWNLFWALAYNIVGVGLATSGWLHPAIAAIAMGASGLLVVSNSLALARFERGSEKVSQPESKLPTEAPMPAFEGAVR